MDVDKTASSLSRTVLLAFGLSLNITPNNSQAANPADDTQSSIINRPGDIRPSLPSIDKPQSYPIEVTPPSVFTKKRKAYGAKFFLKEVKISGNTVYSNEELKKITQPYEDRVIYNSELQDIRIALTQKYIKDGYINSGAVIPDHKVVDGIVEINIIEGKLTEFEIIGTEHLSDEFIIDRLKIGATAPLNINKLQDHIQVILQSPVIESIKSALRPGDTLGEASVTALVKEGPRATIGAIVDNRVSPTLGKYRTYIPIQLNNPMGGGDILTLGLGFADGLEDGNMNWSFPLNPHDTTLSFSSSFSKSNIVHGEFTPLDIKNTASSSGLKVTHPFYRTSDTTFSMSLGVDVKKSESYLLGSGFAFTSGIPADGRVRLTIVRFSQDWSKREKSEVTAVRSLFSIGINANSATINSGDTPSGEFISWLGQFQWAKLLGDDLGQIIFRSNVQLSPDPLFAMEQFSVGGALSVRGYRENQLVRDTGYNLSLEHRYPLIKDGSGKSILTLAPFVDAGGADNNKRSNGNDPDFISSVGLGLRWDPTSDVHAELYWGHALQTIKNNGDSLQENGIHFQLNVNF